MTQGSFLVEGTALLSARNRDPEDRYLVAAVKRV